MLDTTTPTTVALGPGKYGIWTDNPSAGTSGEESQPTFEPLDSPAEVDTQPFQDIADDTDSLPEVAITVPTTVHVAKTFGEVRVQQERQIASFEVTEAGEYTVSVTLPEGDDSDWNYSIGRDTFAVMGGVTQGILQFVMVVLGGSCGGVFGFIGLILVMIHVLRN